jgi:uncharacterized membrane-anchored protein YhcB (DUF1043 family)
MKKDNILYGFIMVLVIILLFMSWTNSRQQKKLQDKIEEGNKMIIKMDKLTKEGDGQYAKLVNYFNTQKDLNNQLKEQNKDLYKLIKKQDERLLMINNTVITLRSEISNGFGSINQTDTNLIDLKLKYPSEGDNFISWDGVVNRKNAFYSGEWSFGKLPLQMIMTETDRGIWKHRIIGPDWLIVDSMEINSLPLPTVEKPKNFGILFGGGYIHSFNNNLPNAVTVGVGARFKSHNLIINGTSNQQLGFNYYYNIVNFGKKK